MRAMSRIPLWVWKMKVEKLDQQEFNLRAAAAHSNDGLDPRDRYALKNIF